MATDSCLHLHRYYKLDVLVASKSTDTRMDLFNRSHSTRKLYLSLAFDRFISDHFHFTCCIAARNRNDTQSNFFVFELWNFTLQNSIEATWYSYSKRLFEN